MSINSLKSNLVIVPLKYGLYGAGMVVVFFSMFYLLNLDPLVNIKMLDPLFLGIFIFFALKEFRDRYNQRRLHFWQGMTGGVICYITIALISALFILLMTLIVDPELTSQYITGRLILLSENKQNLIETINEETYIRTLEGVKQTSGFDLALDDFLKKSIIGLFLTIVIAVILRK